MPSSPDEIDFESSSSSYSHRLSVPSVHGKMERHVSEPAPRMSSQSPPLSSSAMHLLTVPHAPVLTKQHSAPSQSICDTQFPYRHQDSHSHLSLHRQLSLPSAHSPPINRNDPFTIAEEKESLSSSSHTVRAPINTSISVSVTESKSPHGSSPTFVVVTDPTDLPSSQQPMRVRSEELQRSVSSPQVCISAHCNVSHHFCTFIRFSNCFPLFFLHVAFVA